MKKVLLVFFGLVLLTQVVMLWQRDHGAASVRRGARPEIHQQHPGRGGNQDAGPKVMLT